MLNKTEWKCLGSSDLFDIPEIFAKQGVGMGGRTEEKVVGVAQNDEMELRKGEEEPPRETSSSLDPVSQNNQLAPLAHFQPTFNPLACLHASHRCLCRPLCVCSAIAKESFGQVS